MKILIGCECSGVVRRSFRSLGHDAWSCDIKPAEDGDEHHIQGNIIDHFIIKQRWDLLIAHPDCTYLTVSGNAWAGSPWRREATQWALAFVKTLWALPIPKKCIENPVGRLSSLWMKPTQIIQPWQFWHLSEKGRGEVKATCLWLDNLDPLIPTTPEEEGRIPACLKHPERKDRRANRSRTYIGIGDAMAAQWGGMDPEYFP